MARKVAASDETHGIEAFDFDHGLPKGVAALRTHGKEWHHDERDTGR